MFSISAVNKRGMRDAIAQHQRKDGWLASWEACMQVDKHADGRAIAHIINARMASLLVGMHARVGGGREEGGRQEGMKA
jgi:hypothetical protein